MADQAKTVSGVLYRLNEDGTRSGAGYPCELTIEPEQSDEVLPLMEAPRTIQLSVHCILGAAALPPRQQ